MVASFNRASDGTVSVGTVSIDTSASKLFDANGAASGILDTTFLTTGTGAVTVSVATLDRTAANIDDTDIDAAVDHIAAVLDGRLWDDPRYMARKAVT